MASTEIDQSEDVILDTREGGVALLTLSRPDSLNALDTRLMRRLAEACAVVAEDETVRCVVLTGAGRGFCSGGDRGAIGAAADAAVDATARAERSEAEKEEVLEKRIAWLRRSAEAARLLHCMSKPTIAMINGACAGAGLSLAGACDLRFAGESAKFVAGFTMAGMPGDYGGSWSWTRILGTAKARELYFLNERMQAPEALNFGLVSRVFADDRLREETMAIAQRLAGYPSVALDFAKRNLNAAAMDTIDEALDRDSRNMMLSRQVLTEIRARKRAETA